tara:strand:- start:2002 stop:2931 length:930 start_codon:yes stop_codon:yes gene_type:complete
MTQDNIQTDTPQEGANEQQYNSLEEAVFGGDITEGSNDVSSAFTNGNEGNTETAPAETGQPEVSNEEVVPQEKTQNNDENRYQYWQSQADKYKNELDALKQQQSQAQPEAPVEQEADVEEFPPPPEKPKRPRTYNREEAYADPNSESARYLDEVEEWRDNISEYNSLKTQYDNAIMQEKFENLEKERVEAAKKQQASQQQAAQQAEIKSHVMANYGMSEVETNDFMQKMSDPASITIDNLVQLYRLQNGNSAKGNEGPSPAFQQTKNAQQVPSPMGVMPSGQSNTDNQSFEDKVMDNLIGNFNSKNPWK